MSAGKYRFIFLTKASRRSKTEQENIEELMKMNQDFFKLELIKEKTLMIYNAKNADDAKEIFDEIGSWILSCGFKSLLSWHNEIEKNWLHIKNYFEFKVTTALSEGINNVIKTRKIISSATQTITS
jgi:transposase